MHNKSIYKCAKHNGAVIAQHAGLETNPDFLPKFLKMKEVKILIWEEMIRNVFEWVQTNLLYQSGCISFSVSPGPKARILKLPVILETVPVKKVDAAGENQVKCAVARKPSRVGSRGALEFYLFWMPQESPGPLLTPCYCNMHIYDKKKTQIIDRLWGEKYKNCKIGEVYAWIQNRLIILNIILCWFCSTMLQQNHKLDGNWKISAMWYTF